MNTNIKRWWYLTKSWPCMVEFDRNWPHLRSNLIDLIKKIEFDQSWHSTLIFEGRKFEIQMNSFELVYWISRNKFFRYLLSYFDCFDLNGRDSFVEKSKIVEILIWTWLLFKKSIKNLALWNTPLNKEVSLWDSKSKDILYLKTIFLNYNLNYNYLSILCLLNWGHNSK